MGPGTTSHRPPGKQHHGPVAALPVSVICVVSNREWANCTPPLLEKKMRTQARLGDSEALSDTYWFLGVKIDPERQEMLF